MRHNRNHPPPEDDEEDEERPRRRQWPRPEQEREPVPEDPLWVEYGIKPSLPVIRKIEILYVDYRLEVEEISMLMDRTAEQVQTSIDKIEANWIKMGQTLDGPEREKERGRAISQLQRAISDIEREITGSNDPRLKTIKINMMERLVKLQGLDSAVKNEEKAPDTDPITTALEGLTPEKLRELHEKLTAT